MRSFFPPLGLTRTAKAIPIKTTVSMRKTARLVSKCADSAVIIFFERCSRADCWQIYSFIRTTPSNVFTSIGDPYGIHFVAYFVAIKQEDVGLD